MNIKWLSWEWFTPETLRAFHWAEPYYLYILLIIPVLFLIKWFRAARKKVSLPFSLVAVEEGGVQWFTVLRFIIPLLFTLGLISAILALARPQRTFAAEDRVLEGLNLILALDISESMMTTDLEPNRLEVAKRVASRFILERKADKIGLVVFAGEAFSLCPLTTDYHVLQSYLDLINPNLVTAAGTAIGDAIAMGINRLRDIPGENKAIILLSDGDNTAGDLPPEMATQLAKSFGIRIYTIALGQAGSSGLDRQVLNEVAGDSKGKFFEATSSDNLQLVFNRIEQLEQARLLQHYQQEYSDYYFVYLKWAMLLFLLSFLFRVSPIGNILED